MSDLTTKSCNKCGVEYPLTAEFWNKDVKRKDGFKNVCKGCRKAEYREYYEKNIDRERERSIRFRIEHTEKAKAKDKKYRLSHLRETSKATREWQKKNPDRVNGANRRYRKHCDGKHLEAIKNRRARIKQAEGTYTREEVRRIYEQQNGLCFHCGLTLNGKFHEDHWIPLSRGGNNWISNIRLLCPRCNNRKYNKLPHEWCPEKYKPE